MKKRVVILGIIITLAIGIMCCYKSDMYNNKSIVIPQMSFPEQNVSTNDNKEKVEEITNTKIYEENSIPYISLPFNFKHEPLSDIATDKIKEISVSKIISSSTIELNNDIKDDLSKRLKNKSVIESKDNYLFLSKVNYFSNNDSNELGHYRPVSLLVKDNKIISVNELDVELKNPILRKVQKLSNGDILVLYTGENPIYSYVSCVRTTGYNSTVVCLTSDGKLKWHKSLKQDSSSGGKVFSFITPNNEIMVIGSLMTYYDKTKGIEKDVNIAITKLDCNGNIIIDKIIETDGREYIDDICYSPDFGVIIIGDTKSGDKPFNKIRAHDENNRADFIMKLDEKFKVKWVKPFQVTNGYAKDCFINNNRLYITQHIRSADDKQIGVIGIYNKYGDAISSIKSGLTKGYIIAETVLHNNDFVMGFCDNSTTNLYVYSNSGKVLKRINLSYKPNDIIPLEKGFIIKTIREIRTLPQPAYISCIWTDVEVLIEKYNQDYELEWRKTYNKYDDMKHDLVVVLDNETILVE